MQLRLGDTAPDFTAETTEGPIRFHKWIGDGCCYNAGIYHMII